VDDAGLANGLHDLGYDAASDDCPRRVAEQRLCTVIHFNTERRVVRAECSPIGTSLENWLWNLWSPNWKLRDDATLRTHSRDRSTIPISLDCGEFQPYRHRYGYAPGDQRWNMSRTYGRAAQDPGAGR